MSLVERVLVEVKLIHITSEAEKLIAYCARVSSPNQDNPEYEKLLSYCIKNKHWSIFEMASMCVEITTSRAIAQQILRHRSFHFQEFSQRYAEATNFELYKARKQDLKNRQNSIDDLSSSDLDWFTKSLIDVQTSSEVLYKQAIGRGIAKECARFLLPLSTQTKLYMHGTIRDWVHYLNLRTGNGTQYEHQEIAFVIKEIFIKEFPVISKTLEWTTNSISK